MATDRKDGSRRDPTGELRGKVMTGAGWCPRCGSQRTGQLRFCSKCGFDFGGLSEALAAETAPPFSGGRVEPEPGSSAVVDCNSLHPNQVHKMFAIVKEGTAESSISVPADSGHLLVVGGKVGYVGGHRGGVAHRSARLGSPLLLRLQRLPPEPRQRFLEEGLRSRRDPLRSCLRL